jgi:hypothetical protein
MTLIDEEVPLVITALDHYCAYTRAKQNPDERYRQQWCGFRKPAEQGNALGQDNVDAAQGDKDE